MTGIVKDLMSKHVASITKNMPFTYACRLFKNLHFHHLPVRDENQRLIGMFSTTDAMFALKNIIFHNPLKSEDDINNLVKIEDIMTSDNLLTLKSDDSLERAIEVFQRNNIHSIPIIDNDKIVGIITSKDILAAFRSLINI